MGWAIGRTCTLGPGAQPDKEFDRYSEEVRDQFNILWNYMHSGTRNQFSHDLFDREVMLQCAHAKQTSLHVQAEKYSSGEE
jgi:hypothetical protein